MNQSVIFPDLQRWDNALQMIIFPVQINGVSYQCMLSLEKLFAISQQQVATGDDILALFDECRLDIEDIVETLIAQQGYDEAQSQIIV